MNTMLFMKLPTSLSVIADTCIVTLGEHWLDAPGLAHTHSTVTPEGLMPDDIIFWDMVSQDVWDEAPLAHAELRLVEAVPGLLIEGSTTTLPMHAVPVQMQESATPGGAADATEELIILHTVPLGACPHVALRSSDCCWAFTKDVKNNKPARTPNKTNLFFILFR
jgi:hypothetical protein